MGSDLGSLVALVTSEYTSESIDLLETLKRPEGKTIEFKRDLSSPDGVLRTVVAFANTAGGTLLIGVDDATASLRAARSPVLERLDASPGCR